MCTSLCNWPGACRAPCCGHMCQCPGPRSRPWRRDAPPAWPRSGAGHQTRAPGSCRIEARPGSAPEGSLERTYPPGEGGWGTESSSLSPTFVFESQLWPPLHVNPFSLPLSYLSLLHRMNDSFFLFYKGKLASADLEEEDYKMKEELSSLMHTEET